MAEDLLEKLKRTDFAILTEMVCQDQGNQDFAVLDWTVEPLDKKGFGESEGLFLFHGQGRLGAVEKPWSIVLKILKEPPQEKPASDYFYWKREFLAARSDWLANLDAPVRAQRIYRAVEEDGLIWLWMEHVQDTNHEPWTLNEYAFAARQLGKWHGVYLAGGSQPNDSWLCQDHLRGWLNGQTSETGWDSPEVGVSVSSTAHARHQALWDDLEVFLTTLNRLPQVFSHYDFQRRNLFICKTETGQDELIAIDWALCGFGPLGGDLYHLVGISTAFFGFEATRLQELDAAAFAAYIEGLRSTGWTGNADLARLGYCIWAAGYSGTIFPAVAAMFASEDGQLAQLSFGVSGAQLLNSWSPMFDYCLDCADEARLLMKKLGMM